jgi:RimJ/RimL family protein N-acetyltransferase
MSGGGKAATMAPMPGLTLRERRPEDLPVLWRWLHGEDHPEWQRWDGPYFPRSGAKKTLSEFVETARPPGPHRRIIALDGECIGMVSRSEEEPAGGGWWELGIVIYDPRHWGGGFGRQALRLWTSLTFAETDAHVLTLTTWSGNERMVRSAQRVGYCECARIPEARLWQGQRWDSVKLCALRREWETGA